MEFRGQFTYLSVFPFQLGASRGGSYVYCPLNSEKLLDMSLEPWISCRDVNASVKFYTEILDFEIVSSPNPDPLAFDSRHAVLKRGNQFMHLDSHAREEATFGAGFYVRVENIDELFERFTTNGLSISDQNLENGPINQSWGMREFWFEDPDRNRICFGQELG